MTKQDVPLVSVITPFVNASATLSETLQSVQAQEFTNWELIAADDGSRDDSHDLATAIAAQDGRIRVLPAEPQQTGAGPTRNRALAAARGRYIAFLDSDDLWLPQKLSRQLEEMEKTGAVFICSAYIVRRENQPDKIVVPPRSHGFKEALMGNRIGCLTAMYDTEYFGKMPMPHLRRRQDYALWLDLLLKSDNIVGLQEPLAVHVRRPGSLSSNLLKSVWGTWLVYHRHVGLSAPYATWALINQVLRRIVR